MTAAECTDLKQLALLAELARPLTHECNNFLNNLLLQLAISEKSLPEPTRTEWANLRQDARKLANLFQQWQRQRKHDPSRQTRMEINQLIQECADEICSESAQVPIHVRPAAQPLWFVGSIGEMQRLASMNLRYAVATLLNSGVDEPALDIHILSRAERILLQLRGTGASVPSIRWSEFDDLASSERSTTSLIALACKSMAERLQGCIRIEQESNGCAALILDLPLAVS